MYGSIVIGAGGPHSNVAAAVGPAKFMEFGAAMQAMMAEAAKEVLA